MIAKLNLLYNHLIHAINPCDKLHCMLKMGSHTSNGGMHEKAQGYHF